jgi:hypothetical protein
VPIDKRNRVFILRRGNQELIQQKLRRLLVL